MSGVRGRLQRLEQQRGAAEASLVGLAERMRKMHAKSPLPPRPRSREDYVALMARTGPKSVAHKMAKRSIFLLDHEWVPSSVAGEQGAYVPRQRTEGD